MAFVLRNLKFSKVEAVSVVDKGASGDDRDHLRPRIVLMKRHDEAKKETPKRRSKVMGLFFRKQDGEEVSLDSIMGKLSDAEKEFLMAALSKQEEEPEAEKAEGEGDAEKQGDEEDMEKRLAELPESIRKKIEAGERAEAKVADLEKKARAAEFATVAKSLDHVPGISTDDLAAVLEKADRSLGSSDYEKLLKALRSAHEAVSKGEMLRELGAGGPTPGSAEAEIDARAEALMKSDPKLTKARARVQVMESSKELFKRYTDERQGGIH